MHSVGNSVVGVLQVAGKGAETVTVAVTGAEEPQKRGQHNQSLPEILLLLLRLLFQPPPSHAQDVNYNKADWVVRESSFQPVQFGSSSRAARGAGANAAVELSTGINRFDWNGEWKN